MENSITKTEDSIPELDHFLGEIIFFLIRLNLLTSSVAESVNFHNRLSEIVKRCNCFD